MQQRPQVTERPILFQGAMVRAILDGSKTQTRRVLKVQPVGTPVGYRASLTPSGSRPVFVASWDERAPDGSTVCICPYGVPGDRLWVRETWAQNENQVSDIYMDTSLVYRANGEQRALDNGTEKPWRPAIHMPRWACRLVLEVVAVRVERLQGISAADAWAEGIPHSPDVDPSHEYRDLWSSINGAGSWDANPWVWVVEFRKAAA